MTPGTKLETRRTRVQREPQDIESMPVAKRELSREETAEHYKQIRKLQKELAASNRIKDQERDVKSKARLEEAEVRHAILAERLQRLGLDDIFASGVHVNRWDMDGGWPEVWICIKSGQGPNSEQMANLLLDRLEAALSPASS